MTTTMNTEISQYLRQLKSALADLPPASSQAIFEDVQSHIAEAMDAGRDPQEILLGLGPASEVAAAAREELGTSQDAGSSRYVTKILVGSATVLAIITAVVVAFILPSYAGVIGADTTGSAVLDATSLFDEYGIGLALLALVPALLAALPLLLPNRLQRVTIPASAALTTVLSMVVGFFDFGGFYLPTIFLLWSTTFVSLWIRTGRSPKTGLAWRIVGAAIIFSPMLLALTGALNGAFADPTLLFWAAVLVIFVVAALFAFKVKFVDVLVAALGLYLLIEAVLNGGILVMAVWISGGIYLAIGLTSFATRSSQESKTSSGLG